MADIPLAPRPTSADLECPHARWQRLRQHLPVAAEPDAGFVIVSRHEDVCYVAMHPELFSSNLVAVLMAGNEGQPRVLDVRSAGPEQADALALADPPVHTRQRQLLNPAFNVRRIATLEPAIRQLARDLVDRIPAHGPFDWMEAFAVPLPVTVIADVLSLPRADVPRIRRWSDAGVQLLSGVNTPDELLACHRTIVEFQQYLLAAFRQQRATVCDGVMGDLVRGVEQGVLSEPEVLNVLVTLVTAGNETTTSAIGAATRQVLSDPALQARLRSEPSAIPNVIEEVMRLESPFHGHFRVATADTVIAGVPIPAGTRLMLSWGAGNRDDAVFADAASFDPDRAALKSHLAFGHGIHFCLGASLARLEARVAIETLLERLPQVRLSPGHVDRHVPSLFVRRLVRLDLER